MSRTSPLLVQSGYSSLLRSDLCKVARLHRFALMSGLIHALRSRILPPEWRRILRRRVRHGLSLRDPFSRSKTRAKAPCDSDRRGLSSCGECSQRSDAHGICGTIRPTHIRHHLIRRIVWWHPGPKGIETALGFSTGQYLARWPL